MTVDQLEPGLYLWKQPSLSVGENHNGKLSIDLAGDIIAVAEGDEFKEITARPDQRVRWSLEGGGASITFQRLAVLGWNDDLDDPQFTGDAAEQIQLQLTHYREWEGKEWPEWTVPGMPGGGMRELTASPDALRRAKDAQRNFQRDQGAPAKPSASLPKPTSAADSPF